MATRHDIEQEAAYLHAVIARAVAETRPVNLGAISNLLHQTTSAVESLMAGEDASLTVGQQRRYFPPRPDVPAEAEGRIADLQWREALARGRRFRDAARAQVGPLLSPAQTAQRIGVSAVTVNKWRRQGKLLGLRFDDHQYLYPAFQFAESPLQGERGVIRYFDTMLQALGDRTEWEKAMFFLAPLPALHGQRPVDILGANPTAEAIEQLCALAHRAGEMGR